MNLFLLPFAGSLLSFPWTFDVFSLSFLSLQTSSVGNGRRVPVSKERHSCTTEQVLIPESLR